VHTHFNTNVPILSYGFRTFSVRGTGAQVLYISSEADSPKMMSACVCNGVPI